MIIKLYQDIPSDISFSENRLYRRNRNFYLNLMIGKEMDVKKIKVLGYRRL